MNIAMQARQGVADFYYLAYVVNIKKAVGK